MPDQQGVYVSITTQTPSTKVLFSTARDTWAECKQDLRDIFGDEFAEGITGVAGAGTGVDTSRPTLTVVQVAEELGAQQGETQEFEKCSCGYLKDRWVPPGTSKSGKPYAGFFGCGGPTRHR